MSDPGSKVVTHSDLKKKSVSGVPIVAHQVKNLTSIP